ncbi:hypothetical protein [Peribacillus sp. SCS-155]|uniref:hypothetical protein n=1 Tax=Peribacillus sedimenti TaxID=3115297 RepID=UPI0039068F26
MVQHKLLSETSGRKKNQTHPLPTIMICRFCGTILQNNKEVISCVKCSINVEKNKVSSVIQKQLSDYVFQNQNILIFKKIMDKLIVQYQMKSWKIARKVERLLERKGEIKNLEMPVKTERLMLNENTKLLSNYCYEQSFIDVILFYFNTMTDAELEEQFRKRSKLYLSQLPFLTFIDFIDMS